MPDRDYYLKDDAVYAALRVQYARTSRAGVAGEATPPRIPVDTRPRDADRETALACASVASAISPTIAHARGARAARAGLHLECCCAEGVDAQRASWCANSTPCRTGAAVVQCRGALAPTSGITTVSVAECCAASTMSASILWPHAQRPATAARALEARGRRARRRSGEWSASCTCSATFRRFEAAVLALVENLRAAYAQRIEQLPG